MNIYTDDPIFLSISPVLNTVQILPHLILINQYEVCVSRILSHFIVKETDVMRG